MDKPRLNSPSYDDEIDLLDFVRVLLKHKKTLLITVSLAMIIAAAVISRQPTIYEVSMVLEPPCIDVNIDKAQLNYLLTWEDIKAGAAKGIFPAAPEALKISPLAASNLVKVSLEVPLSDIEVGENTLLQFAARLKYFYRGFVEVKQHEMDQTMMARPLRSEPEIEKLKLKKAMISNLKIVNGPQVSHQTIHPRHKKLILVAALCGFFLGLVIIFLQELGGVSPAAREKR